MFGRLSDRALRRIVWLLALSLALLLIMRGLGQPAGAAEPPGVRILSLAPDAELLDPWPSMMVMTGSDILSIEGAEEAWDLGRFHTSARYPWSNIGRQSGPVWLRLGLDVSEAATGQRMIAVDYPSLDEISWWAVNPDGQIRALGMTGDYQRVAARTVNTRMLVLPVDFDRAGEWTLYARIRTTSTVVVPTSIAMPDRLYQEDSRETLLQGVLVGISLCLMLYAICYWLISREYIYLGYALTVGANACFFLAFSGVGPLHLWGDSEWLTRNIAPAAAQLSVAAATQFYIDVFEMRRRRHWLKHSLTAIGAVSALGLVVFVLGFVDYVTAQTWATVTGVLPMILIVPEAIVRLRKGDRMMRILLPGLVVYALCIFVTAAILRGLIGAHSWATHAMQVGSMFEVIAWILLLLARSSERNRVAENVRQERDAMHSLAHTDVLTGLSNRRGLVEALPVALKESVSSGRQLAVFMIDLDGFKPINDRHGHEVGDRVLEAVARRLRASVRQGDTVARVGGDEFVVVVANIPDEPAMHVVRQKLQSAFSQPMRLGDLICRVDASIGHALTGDAAEDLDALLRRADEAMYQVKRSRDLQTFSI